LRHNDARENDLENVLELEVLFRIIAHVIKAAVLGFGIIYQRNGHRGKKSGNQNDEENFCNDLQLHGLFNEKIFYRLADILIGHGFPLIGNGRKFSFISGVESG
jgi:hypothetical protein